MTGGPPPSESGPSKPTFSPAAATTIPNHFVQPLPQGVAQPASANQFYPYYGYPASWTNAAWSGSAYQYGSQLHQPYPQANTYTQQFMHYPAQVQPHASAVVQSATERKSSVSQPTPATPPKPKARTPSPTPPRELPQYWDAAIKSFLSSAGLIQALKGFEADMLVLNAEWERDEVPDALDELATDLKRLLGKGESSDHTPSRSLEERKLDYVHLEKDAEPRSQTSTNKSIALFLARNRARNDASNRNEFLHAQKRRRLGSADQSMSLVADDDERAPSCARTDAKTVDRDVMMKFDIARNEEGPLRRTMKTEEQEPKLEILDDKTKARTSGESGLTAERHPGIDERLKNIETHTAMRYVPSPPVSLLHRIKFIEDHIIQLEREYPPWAALHFNQPRRGWPPPPRPTPIIVPSHLTSSEIPAAAHASGSIEPADGPSSSPTAGEIVNGASKLTTDTKGKGRTAKSSLHRAVMERLEVQRAMSDLRGESNES